MGVKPNKREFFKNRTITSEQHRCLILMCAIIYPWGHSRLRGYPNLLAAARAAAPPPPPPSGLGQCCPLAFTPHELLYKLIRQQTLYQIIFFNTIALDECHICTYTYLYNSQGQYKKKKKTNMTNMSVHPCLLSDPAEVRLPTFPKGPFRSKRFDMRTDSVRD